MQHEKWRDNNETFTHKTTNVKTQRDKGRFSNEKQHHPKKTNTCDVATTTQIHGEDRHTDRWSITAEPLLVWFNDIEVTTQKPRGGDDWHGEVAGTDKHETTNMNSETDREKVPEKH